jgi:1,4-dihydroxy-2-naphthoate octaprenyltransferase
MKTQPDIRRLGFLAVIFLSVISASADPIELPEKPITPEITILISLAIFLEVVCILLVLRRSQKPRFFILWLIGIHLVTYPAFLGFLWLEQNMRPAFAAGIGEGLVVLVEGTLIYLICRFIQSAKSNLAIPSIFKCLLASLIGNILSASAFPILMAVYDRFPSN